MSVLIQEDVRIVLTRKNARIVLRKEDKRGLEVCSYTEGCEEYTYKG